MRSPEQLELDFSKEPNPQDICSSTAAVNEAYAEEVDEEDEKVSAAEQEYAEAYRERLKHEPFEGPADPFSSILQELQVLHNKKRADYGSKTDPYANVRASAEFGIPPWIGVMVRANDKVKRIKAAAMGSTMQNESIIDSFNDLAVYAIIARILYEAHDSLDKAIKDGYVSEAQVS